ncbi:MAG: hypothetical protein KKB70_07205 [Proteobacteria bacterium]|nr:hypothetical protein [Pseudomonadota bacterium]MBU1611835.1 hypothetical protein [Pseudomonadota bacterium]
MIKLIACACLALMFLTACGGPEVDEADPVAVARVAALAWKSSDLDSMLEVVCSRMRDSLENSRQEMEQMAEIMRSMGVDSADVRYDFSQVEFQAEKVEEFTANVKMTGPLIISIPGRADEVRDLDQELGMLMEDGDWKLCSEID